MLEKAAIHLIWMGLGFLLAVCVIGIASILKGGMHHQSCQCPNCLKRFQERRKEAQRKI